MNGTWAGRGAAPIERGWKARAARGLLWLALMAWVAGCQLVKESAPPRTATEQLLLSTATDSALEDTRFSWLEGKRVFVEEKYFESYDKGYAVGLIRERLSASGALLAKTDDKADVIVEIRSGALSINASETLVGLPAMTMPVPLTGPVPTPEIGLFSKRASISIAKIALFAYERPSGRYLQSAGPMVGRAHFHLYKILFVSWRGSDVPELSRRAKPRFSQVPPPSGQGH
jgi:hypothetical protein